MFNLWVLLGYYWVPKIILSPGQKSRLCWLIFMATVYHKFQRVQKPEKIYTGSPKYGPGQFIGPGPRKPSRGPKNFVQVWKICLFLNFYGMRVSRRHLQIVMN